MTTDDPLTRIARAIHENYLAEQVRAGTPMGSTAAMVAWEALPEDLKQANCAQARDIEMKLAAIGCRTAPMAEVSVPFAFRDDEVEVLSHREHQRWSADRVAHGWTHAAVRDDAERHHPSLVSWDELSEADRDKDRNAVRNLPAVLAAAGLGIVRSS